MPYKNHVISTNNERLTSGFKPPNRPNHTGKSFRVYFDKYDVLQVNGDRVVIGVGDIVTAAVRVTDVKRV